MDLTWQACGADASSKSAEIFSEMLNLRGPTEQRRGCGWIFEPSVSGGGGRVVVVVEGWGCPSACNESFLNVFLFTVEKKIPVREGLSAHSLQRCPRRAPRL